MSIEHTIKSLLEESRKFKDPVDEAETKKKLDDKDSPSDGDDENPENKKNNVKDQKDAEKLESEEEDNYVSEEEKPVKDVNDEDEDEEEDEKEEKDDKKNESFDMTADVDALFNGEDGMTEEFRQKAETIFESAVVNRIKDEVQRIEESYEARLEEQYSHIADSLVEQVDGYLNLMIENWMEENEIALENGIRNDIMENFMGGLKSLFQESYIDVPDEKYDLVSELEEKIESLSSKLDETFESNIELRKELTEKKRVEIVSSISEGLSDIDAEKLQSLAEEIDFNGEQPFTQKLQTIRENYFNKKSPENSSKVMNSFITENVVEEEKEVSAHMKPYVNALSQFIK